MPEPARPIVPLHVNVYLPPQPTPARCHAWGQALGEILRARPERVALIASGGMSHFPGTERYASPEFEHDRGLLEALADGPGREPGPPTPHAPAQPANTPPRPRLTPP